VKSARAAVFTAIFVTAFGFYVEHGVRDGGLAAAPEPGDGHDYDALAFNLWRHHRFGYAWDDADWRRPYIGNTLYMPLLSRHGGYYPTTYRQPAAPAAMALVYTVTNRSFAAWRLVSCALTAAGVVAASATAALFAGLPAAVFTAALVLLLPLPTMFSYLFMTESLALFLVALLAWQWTVNARAGWTTASAVGSGVVLGALICTRSIFTLFLPLAFIVPAGDPRIAVTRVVPHRAACVLAALLVAAPWWVRNCVVLHAFMPFGTQGALNIPAGFGPAAIEHSGLWVPIPADATVHDIQALHLDPVSTEVAIARARSRATVTWVRNHPGGAIGLAWLHIWQEIKPREVPTPTGAWLLPAAIAATLVLRRRRGVSVIVWMTAVNIAAVAATWSVGGRFMLPVQPILAALVGAAVADLTRTVPTGGERFTSATDPRSGPPVRPRS